MRPIARSVLLIAALAALPLGLSACGDDDTSYANNNATNGGTTSTNGGTTSTNGGTNTNGGGGEGALSSLSAAERAALCAEAEASYTAAFDTVTPEQSCAFVGVLLTGDPNTCQEFIQDCLADGDSDPEFSAEECLEAPFDTCDAQASDLSACIADTFANQAALIRQMTCDIAGDDAAITAILGDDFEAAFGPASSCAPIEQTCPDFFSSDPSECDPAVDAGCACFDNDTGFSCDAPSDTCSCYLSCGDGFCDFDEDPSSCAADCSADRCGDGECDFDENDTFCPDDCNFSAVCGDGFCDLGEDPTSCSDDCSADNCGDGDCSFDENDTFCPVDCNFSLVCGDGFCDFGEDPSSCSDDCSTDDCGDGVCQFAENDTFCPDDCAGQFCGDGTCDISESAELCPEDCGDPGAFRFVMLTDLSADSSGTAPGADIDAVELVKASGESFFATTVEDFDGSFIGDFVDVNQALGAPDSQCDAQNFYAMGGGYVIFGFSSLSSDITIEPGDAIRVYELGQSFCADSPFNDDAVGVGLSANSSFNTFATVGVAGADNGFAVTVP